MPADRVRLTAAIRAAYPGATFGIPRCGGFACTFRVQRGADDLAVKIIDPTQAPTIREDREVLALGSVDHPNVVRYRRAGTVVHGGETFRYLEMDWIDGRPLGEMFAAGHSFSPTEVATIAEGIVNGAAAIWAAGLAHRDLSPNNVLVKPDGLPVIVDLGIARHMNLPTATTTLPTPGTPGWMSPEQVDQNPERGDWLSDQFVIGLLLYRIATGLIPFQATSLLDLWRAPVEKTMLPPRFVNRTLPSMPARMIERLTQREPRQRYLQVNDLVGDLSLALAQLAGATLPPGLARPADFFVAVGTVKNHIDAEFLTTLRLDGMAFDARCIVPGELAERVVEAQHANASAVVDPVNYYDQSPPASRPTYYRRLLYEDQAVRVTTPAFADDSARTAYATPILRYQQAAGANIDVAPYFYADHNGGMWIDESLRMGAIACAINAQLNPPRAGSLWTGLAIAEHWLRAAGLPTTLSQITRHRPGALYLLIATGQTNAQPLGDHEVLLGLRAVIELMENLGGRVILGRRYSSGLLGLSLGAAGFTVGNAGTHQNFEPPPMSAPQDGRGGRGADWYYVPVLLNSVKIATRAALAGTSAVFAPTDQYDEALFAASPALAAIGTTTQRILLHRHNFLAMRRQAANLAEVDQAGRVTLMRAWVAQAKAHYSSLAHPWDAGESGNFLDAWENVL